MNLSKLFAKGLPWLLSFIFIWVLFLATTSCSTNKEVIQKDSPFDSSVLEEAKQMYEKWGKEFPKEEQILKIEKDDMGNIHVVKIN